jgi:hypothetical protein
MRQKLYNVLEYIVIDYKVNVSLPCASFGLQFDLVFLYKKMNHNYNFCLFLLYRSISNLTISKFT